MVTQIDLQKLRRIQDKIEFLLDNAEEIFKRSDADVSWMKNVVSIITNPQERKGMSNSIACVENLVEGFDEETEEIA